MCDPEGAGWGMGAPAKTVGVFLGAAVAAVVLAGVARLWLPLAVGAVAVVVVTGGAVRLLCRHMIWWHADPVPARVTGTQAVLQAGERPITLPARTFRPAELESGGRRVVPGVVLPAREDAEARR